MTVETHREGKNKDKALDEINIKMDKVLSLLQNQDIRISSLEQQKYTPIPQSVEEQGDSMEISLEDRPIYLPQTHNNPNIPDRMNELLKTLSELSEKNNGMGATASDIASHINKQRSQVSGELKLLKALNRVTRHRSGKNVYYKIVSY